MDKNTTYNCEPSDISRFKPHRSDNVRWVDANEDSAMIDEFCKCFGADISGGFFTSISQKYTALTSSTGERARSLTRAGLCHLRGYCICRKMNGR